MFDTIIVKGKNKGNRMLIAEIIKKEPVVAGHWNVRFKLKILHVYFGRSNSSRLRMYILTFFN